MKPSGASGREDVFTQLDLHCCPKCDNSVFLTVSHNDDHDRQKGESQDRQEFCCDTCGRAEPMWHGFWPPGGG